MKIKTLAMATAAFGALAMAPQAASAGGTASGSANGLSWEATSTIIGQNSTATAAGGGNPAYFASMPKYSGVVSLIMNKGAAGSFICSGTLVSPTHIITAGHCVSNGGGVADPGLVSTKAFFYGGNNPDTIVHVDPASTAVAISQIAVNPLYTGQVVDQNDIAVLTLAAPAPGFAAMYGLDFSGNMQNATFNVAGYGGRSDTGGAIGVNLGVGRLRQGLNTYDMRLGDADFGGFWNGFFGTADITNTWLSDFDNGLAANDTACRIAAALGTANSKYCNLGLGALEVNIAGGDSGGPGFINGKLASVNSFGLTFGTGFGDYRAGLNSSWGEFAGYAPLYASRNFIEVALGVPEPGTWALMIVGFGMIGSTLRRARRAPTGQATA